MKKSKKRVKNRTGKLVPVSELTANDLLVNAAVANVAAKTLREIARVARRAKLRPDELRYRVGELLEGKTASSKKFHTPPGWGR